MVKKSFIAFLAAFFLLSCVCQNKKNPTAVITEKQSFNLSLDSISFIKVVQEDEEYEIRDKNEIKSVITKIESSQIEYIKFGSSNTFAIYDLNSNKIFEGFFRENIFKAKGIVYKSEQNLFR